MPRNVEIKARVGDPHTLRARAEALAHNRGEVLDQRDTFFSVPHGRLKLREVADGSGELIYYERPDEQGPRESRYWRAAATDAPALLALLTAAFGVRGAVEKKRRVFLIGQTRVHLDAVRDLGDFVELEVVLHAAQDAAEGRSIALKLMAELGIAEEDLEPRAYIDLLTSRSDTTDEHSAG